MDGKSRSSGYAHLCAQFEHVDKRAETLGVEVVNVPGWRWLPGMVNVYAKGGRALFGEDVDGTRMVYWLRPDGYTWVDPDGPGNGCVDVEDEATGLQMARLAGLERDITQDGLGWSIRMYGETSLSRATLGEAVAIVVLARGYWTRGGA